MLPLAMPTSKNDRDRWLHPLVPAHQLRIGDVARTPDGKEWEIRDRPRPRQITGGQIIEARVQRPGDPRGDECGDGARAAAHAIPGYVRTSPAR